MQFRILSLPLVFTLPLPTTLIRPSGGNPSLLGMPQPGGCNQSTLEAQKTWAGLGCVDQILDDLLASSVSEQNNNHKNSSTLLCVQTTGHYFVGLSWEEGR